MISNQKNWLFSVQELQEINKNRISSFPAGFTEEHEKKLINYTVQLLKNIIKIVEGVLYFQKEDQFEIFCYSAQIFQRLCLRNSVFKLGNLNQLCLSSTYLALKLYERTENHIFAIVNKLKGKPKYNGFIHYGDENYARQEIFIVSCLNFEIQIPCFYQTIQAVHKIFSIQKKFEQQNFERYLKDVENYLTLSLCTNLIFTVDSWTIAIAIVEASLEKFSQLMLHTKQVQYTHGKPHSRESDTLIKTIYQQFQQSEGSLLLIQYAEYQKQHIPNFYIESIEKNKQKIQVTVRQLQSTRLLEPFTGLEVLKHFEHCKNPRLMQNNQNTNNPIHSDRILSQFPKTSNIDEFIRPENKLRRQSSSIANESPEIRKQIRKE